MKISTGPAREVACDGLSQCGIQWACAVKQASEEQQLDVDTNPDRLAFEVFCLILSVQLDLRPFGDETTAYVR